MTGRNDSCPCGSGKKYKKCCGKAAMELPDVFPYLTGKKALLPSPGFYQKGSDSEAIAYVENMIDLWIDSGAGRYLPELVR